jgi:glutamate N-acetyltransferase/amino-acid N-acetyltransferase
MARAIALSNLVKTAVAGGDPNWGRIVSAAGYCGANFSVSETSLQLNGIEVFREGQPTDFDRKRASQSIKQNRLTEILLTVGSGPGSSEHWTSDLTVEYVKLNAEYTT